MDDLQMEKLKSACVIAGESIARAAEAFIAAAEAFEAAEIAKALRVGLSRIYEDEKHREFAELMRRIGELGGDIDAEVLQELAEIAEEIPPPPKKTPRPPRRIGPVNKANYTANRPPRVARSHLRCMKR